MQKQNLLHHALIVAGVIGLAACGGGGSTSSSSTPANATSSSSTQISGTAASGAPFAGANITIMDANGTRKTATAAADGSYAIDVTGLTAPFVITATGTVGGTTSTYVAVMADALKAGDSKTLNVTPLTTAVAALLSDTSDPLDMTDLTKLKAKATTAEISKIVGALRTVLANVVTSTGANATTYDPMTTAFKADRTGLDSVLDAVKVSLTDQGVVLTNAFAPTAENAADPSAAATPSIALTKVNLATPPAALAAPSVSVSSIATIIDTWRDQLDACFALTAANRVTTSGGAITAIKGSCAQITGFDASYKSNGYTLLQNYGGLLSDAAMDGAKFGFPEILTLIKTDTGEDKAIFRLTYKRSDGDTNHVLDVAQKISAPSGTDSGWRVVGNQRDYDATVQARFDRNVDLKNGGKVSYRSGLRLYFNSLGPNASDVNMVRVTGPGLPAAGVVLGKSSACGTAGYLQIQRKDGVLSVSNTNTRTASAFILGASYADQSSFTWPGTNANWADAPLSDFSTLLPFARYKFEVYRTASDKKAEFFTRITAAPVAAGYGAALQWNELSTAAKTYLDPTSAASAAALTSATVDWIRNPLAAPVDRAFMFGSSGTTRIEAQSAAVKQVSASTMINAAAQGTSFGGSCLDATIPALNVPGNYREITLRSRNRSDVRQYASWFYQN